MTQVLDSVAEQRDALAGRLFESAIAAMDVFSIYLGDRLGFYRALAAGGSFTSTALAAATSTSERYVREWLEQQAATGILTVDDAAAAPLVRQFSLPNAYREVLVEPESINYMAGMLRLVVGAATPLAAVLDAYRTGGGVKYDDYGPDTIEGIAEMNRPMFLNLLGSEWLPAIPEIHARLQANPTAWVADVGCGTGWSSIAIAKAYPNVRIDGFDLNETSIALARRNAEAAGVADRVTFAVRDAADHALAGRYDLVTVFEAIHDMAHPVNALRTVRGLLAEGGSVLVADENVGEEFSAPGDAIERLNYGFSVIHCLPATMAEDGPVDLATGTVMRPPTLRRYATEAGFREVEVLPIEFDFWRFYRLTA
jgi:SAM-dependent methyltransferase